MTAPIFVGGASRSGKTLMRWMLASHPRIAMARRTEMWPRFAERFGDLGAAGNLERCLEAMLARPQIAALEPDIDRVRRDFRVGEPTYGRLFALIGEQYAERCGKVRWGDQSPGNDRFADEILSAYPEARFVHLVRDPRDTWASRLVEKGPRRPGAVATWVSAWMSSAALARANAERYQDVYLVVRYETLVMKPERTMRAVCDLLGEPFDAGMLRMEEVERYRGVDGSPDGPISSVFVGRYVDVLGPTDLVYIQSVAAAEMGVFGYLPDQVRMSARQRIMLATARPAYRIRERLGHTSTWRQRPPVRNAGGRT